MTDNARPLEAFYSKAYKVKAIPVLLLLNLPIPLRLYFHGPPQEQADYLILGLGLVGIFIVFFLVTMPGLAIIFNRKPALALSDRCLSILETGDLKWDSILAIRVVSGLGEKTIRVVPKDKSALKNVPLFFKFQCWMNLMVSGHLVSVPLEGLTLSGEDLMKYFTENHPNLVQ